MRSLGLRLLLLPVVVSVVTVMTVAADDARTAHTSRSTVVTRVVDGDTVEIRSGQHVRLIGVDTPERGVCGYESATQALRRMVEGREVKLVNPSSVQDRDAYERLLRFVDVGGKDAGLAQIRSGLARARYDSRDGYDEHPRETRYRRSDRQHVGACE